MVNYEQKPAPNSSLFKMKAWILSAEINKGPGSYLWVCSIHKISSFPVWFVKSTFHLSRKKIMTRNKTQLNKLRPVLKLPHSQCCVYFHFRVQQHTELLTGRRIPPGWTCLLVFMSERIFRWGKGGRKTEGVNMWNSVLKTAEHTLRQHWPECVKVLLQQ